MANSQKLKSLLPGITFDYQGETYFKLTDKEPDFPDTTICMQCPTTTVRFLPSEVTVEAKSPEDSYALYFEMSLANDGKRQGCDNCDDTCDNDCDDTCDNDCDDCDEQESSTCFGDLMLGQGIFYTLKSGEDVGPMAETSHGHWENMGPGPKAVWFTCGCVNPEDDSNPLNIVDVSVFQPYSNDEMRELVGQVVTETTTKVSLLVTTASPDGKVLLAGLPTPIDATLLRMGFVHEDGYPCGS